MGTQQTIDASLLALEPITTAGLYWIEAWEGDVRDQVNLLQRPLDDDEFSEAVCLSLMECPRALDVIAGNVLSRNSGLIAEQVAKLNGCHYTTIREWGYEGMSFISQLYMTEVIAYVDRNLAGMRAEYEGRNGK